MFVQHFASETAPNILSYIWKGVYKKLTKENHEKNVLAIFK